jgi:hypothetical protein
MLNIFHACSTLESPPRLNQDFQVDEPISPMILKYRQSVVSTIASPQYGSEIESDVSIASF